MRRTPKIVWLWIIAGLTISAGLMFAISSADEVNGTISNGVDQWLTVSLPCNPASVSNGNVNVTTCEITCNAWYDKSWTSCLLHQSGGWGGGGGSSLSKDTCPAGDLSPSLYDGSCSAISTTNDTLPMTGSIVGSPFSSEQNDAYLYAYHLWITTAPTIQAANVEGVLLRSHMAKMMVNYATKVMWLQPNTTLSCTFNDIANETPELQSYIKLACQLGLMGYASDGVTQNASFFPLAIVDRAQFGTVLSRLLRGTKYAGWQPFYIHHLQALKDNAIMTNITDPEHTKELRGRVMLMLMRADKQ